MEIDQAILEHLVLELKYEPKGEPRNEDGMRLVEPHDVFTGKEDIQLVLVWQVDGVSKSGNLPGWRSLETDRISDVRLLRTHFSPRTDHKEKLQSLGMTRLIAGVD